MVKVAWDFKTPHLDMKTIFKDDSLNRIVFHFNKAHNTDSKIPQWVIKHKGQTYYVTHLETEIGFSTKETPDNEHTKGSLLFRGKLEILENEATGVYEAKIY